MVFFLQRNTALLFFVIASSVDVVSGTCIGNGVGQICESSSERPNIACCIRTKTGASYNACCSDDEFSTVGVFKDTTVDDDASECKITGTGVGCPTTVVPGNDGSTSTDFGGKTPCLRVSKDSTCSNQQDDPTKNYGTCTNNGVTFDVCCPPGATGTYAVGDSCAVTVPGRLPTTGAPTTSLVEPTESPAAPPSNPPTDAPVVPAATKVCSAYESCRNANLQGDCCPTIDGQFLGCCEGVDVDSPTTNALEPIIMDPTNAPESSTVLPDPIILDPTIAPESSTVLPDPIILDPTIAPEPAPVPPEPIVSDESNAPDTFPTGFPTRITTLQDPESISDLTNDDPTTVPEATIQPTLALFPASEILTKKPVTIPAATVPPTETNLRGDVAISLIEATSSAHTTSMMSKSLLSILLAMIIGASAF